MNTVQIFMKKTNKSIQVIAILALITIIIIFTCLSAYITYETMYRNRIYPHVSINGVSFGGKTPDEVMSYWQTKNTPFLNANFELRYDSLVATVSGKEIDAGYDGTLSAKQAYLIGRSGNIFTDLREKFHSETTNLAPYFRWNEDILSQSLDTFSDSIDEMPEDALFSFANGRVTSFRPSHNGKAVNREKTKALFAQILASVQSSNSAFFQVPVIVDPVYPKITTDKANSFGLKEKIGTGYSEFSGSIAGRIHNVALAAAKLNGVMIAPGETFSFNHALGDVSASTGFQQAYIIKNGRTVLGDGGGVCQVSTTLFRAAMDAGLPILERHAHDYRVHYYEEGGFKAGLDATVFDPSYDLKIKNNTPAYILIQTKTDTNNLTLEFDLYGTNDGRISQISNQKLWGITPPPTDLYQDDPTLKVGIVKQVDWSAWGAKAAFDYKVTRGNEQLENTTFFSNYRPWQAIYLKGTMP
jgi:vancomycin resistance protein YoaR